MKRVSIRSRENLRFFLGILLSSHLRLLSKMSHVTSVPRIPSAVVVDIIGTNRGYGTTDVVRKMDPKMTLISMRWEDPIYSIFVTK